MKKTLSTVLFASLLAGCGGGGGDAPPAVATVPGSDVPVAATQDPAAAVDFVASVVATSSESADPLTIGDAPLATSETDDPKAL